MTVKKTETELEKAAALLLGGQGKRKAPAPALPPLTDAEKLQARAEEWARLHSNPRLRPEMDRLLEGLCPADQRTVYLNGQRLRAGMPYKIFPSPQPTKGAKHGDTNTGTAQA